MLRELILTTNNGQTIPTILVTSSCDVFRFRICKVTGFVQDVSMFSLLSIVTEYTIFKNRCWIYCISRVAHV